MLVRTGCAVCEHVLAELPSVHGELPEGYDLKVSARLDNEVPLVDNVGVVRSQVPQLVPTPALLLVDPDGIIQGKGAAVNGASVREFVEEGLLHGYGPDALVEDRASRGSAVPRSAVHPGHTHTHPRQLEDHG